MQGITMAFGPLGIGFLAESLLAGVTVDMLGKLKPADRQIALPDFGPPGDRISKCAVTLTQGALIGFAPQFAHAAQTDQGSPPGSRFAMTLNAQNFSASYCWSESYHEHTQHQVSGQLFTNDYDLRNSYGYAPAFGNLAVVVSVDLCHVAGSHAYQVQVAQSAALPSGLSGNIPRNSVLNGQTSSGCLSTKVSDATAASLANVGFDKLIEPLIKGVIASIPDSGELGDKIRFGFDLGADGLQFPNGETGKPCGLQIGVTGLASFDGQSYPATPPAPLPLPAVPGPQDRHLNANVSDWALNGLFWAYFAAGKLDLTLQAADLPDPDVLKCRTYADLIPALKRYGNAAMEARIAPLSPPMVQFQQVWTFSAAAMARLAQRLPADTMAKLAGFGGDSFVSLPDLLAELAQTGIEESFAEVIAEATKVPGMVVAQKMNFVLTILDGSAAPPTIAFDLTRTDVLEDLGLGVTGSAQTLIFGFHHVASRASDCHTSVPGLDAAQFDLFWPVIGESRYAEVLMQIGKAGLPLPIAQGFVFLFDRALVTIEEGFVLISADLKFRASKLPAAVAALHVPLRRAAG